MILRAVAAFLLVLVVIPLGMGKALITGESGRLSFVGGYFASLFIFEILQLVFHVTMGSLRLMTLLWCLICGAIAVFGFWRYRKKGKGNKPRATVIYMSRAEWILLTLAVAMIVLQILNTVLNTYYGNWDDETYCSNAVTAWYTDTICRYSPHSGMKLGLFYNTRYVVAGWPIYSAMLAVLSGIHPAIVYRTILPVFEIPAAYVISGSLLDHFFFHDRKKTLLGLIYFQMFALLAVEKIGGNTNEWWLIVNCWTGKALAFNIMTPLVLLLLFLLEDEQQEKKAVWRTLMAVSGACCLIAGSLFTTIPILLFVWGGCYVLRTKRWEDIGRVLLCMAPTTACALFTILY